MNGSRNTDKLLEISEAMKHRNDLNASNLKDTPLPRYEEGESLSRIWVAVSYTHLVTAFTAAVVLT